MNELHFSPRPNRANEIAWKSWKPETFESARQADKPVLLAISAVWCHWCHVMDETSYSDPRVIAAINENFVPIRVDNDRRPDINARYNQGGWPTTAFLAPDGTLLTGGTYMPPEQLLEALDHIAQFYRENRDRISERSTERTGSSLEKSSGDLRLSMIARITEEVSDAYDPTYGGFGNEPKFPMTDVLEFLWQEYRAGGEQRLYDMLARSIVGMSNGGMYDHVEGGFFRYSTTRDWSIPHYEKMAEDLAVLIRLLAQLVRVTRGGEFRETLVSTLHYVRTTLRDSETNLFAGSQDADETYYGLPLEERRKHEPPYVDRTSYSNWTAAMAGSFVLAADALDDDKLLHEGEAALDALHDRLRDESGLLYHFVEPGGTPDVRGLCVDQAAYLRALLDAHEYGGSPRFLERAREVAEAIQATLSAPEGGFYDRAKSEAAIGSLARPQRPLPENCSLAESFLRLASLLDDRRLRDVAENTLKVFAGSYGRSGLFAAPFGKALRRYFAAESSAVLVGGPSETEELREAVHGLPDPFINVRTIDPARAEGELGKRGFDPKLKPAVYICRGTACAAPVLAAAELRSAYESVSSGT